MFKSEVSIVYVEKINLGNHIPKDRMGCLNTKQENQVFHFLTAILPQDLSHIVVAYIGICALCRESPFVVVYTPCKHETAKHLCVRCRYRLRPSCNKCFIRYPGIMIFVPSMIDRVMDDRTWIGNNEIIIPRLWPFV